MSENETTRRLPTLEKRPVPEDAGGGAAEGSEPAAGDGHEIGGGGKAGRFWAGRRGPAALVALLLLAGTGLLLYDLASVRGGRTGMAWRRSLIEELETTRLDELVVIAGAVVAALLGLWLIVLAVTPGQRKVLPMRGDTPDVRAGLERGAAELVLRDRAMEVSGVQTVRVDVGRRKAKVRARSHFRPQDEVRDDLHAALVDGLRELGLARPLSLDVRVRRPAGKG